MPVAVLLLVSASAAQAFSFCFSFGGGGSSRGNAGLYSYPLPAPGFAPGGYPAYPYSPVTPDLSYGYYPPAQTAAGAADNPEPEPRPTLGWPR